MKKEQNDTAIKDIRNLFRPKKKLKELKIQYLGTLRTFFNINNKKKITINQ